ncbi:MAG: choice-of-anchor B family protein, partial [Balneolaceae bacterium]
MKNHCISVLTSITILFFLSCGTDSTDSEPPFSACENGMVLNQYPCNNVGLYARVSLDQLGGVRGNDLWAWTDPQTRKEYALVGLTDGVSIVDVTNPAEPLVIGKLLESTHQANSHAIVHHAPLHDEESGGFKDASAWRDIKVYRNYMLVVSEERNHGMQVFDLTRLRGVESAPAVFTEDALYDKIGNAHNVAVNEESGYAYIVGSTTGEECAEFGGLHIVNINNPLQPEFAGCHIEPEAGGVIANGYIHDTQCVIYRGPDARFRGRELCFSSSERKFLISDVTDKSNPETVAVLSYDGNQYSHQGWLSEDHGYFYMNDELDELNQNHNTRTYIWDLQDLENPDMIGF